MSFDRLWASWRSSYVQDATAASREHRSGCIFCGLISEGSSPESGVIAVDELTACVLNAYPYGSGHLLVLPRRHESSLLSLDEQESAALWVTAKRALAAVEAAYRPDGVNLGANLGEAAGAGIPAHLHIHVLPRWSGDTNFMTSLAETRVLPEPLAETWAKVHAASAGGLLIGSATLFGPYPVVTFGLRSTSPGAPVGPAASAPALRGTW